MMIDTVERLQNHLSIIKHQLYKKICLKIKNQN